MIRSPRFRMGAILLFACTASSSVNGQVDSTATESLLEHLETDADNSELLDRLQWLQEHPFDLNTVSAEELATIPRLTPYEITAIVNLRKHVKLFRSVDQLGILEEENEQLVMKVRPYVIVNVGEEIMPMTISFASRTVHDLQPRAGFQSNSFSGSPLKNYSRLTISQPDKATVGILFEKDAGERVGEGFVSGYATINNVAFISQAIIGDYVVEAGQGLALWRGTAFGKGSEAVFVAKKSGIGALPYRSADEFNFMRGLAVSSAMDVGESRFLATAFFSRRSLSATCLDADSTHTGAISSFYEEGLFRTANEIEKRNRLSETMIGGRAQYFSSSDWSIGATFYRSTFDKPIVSDRLFEFSGSKATIAGVDGSVNLGWRAPGLSQISLFGELASSGDGAAAGVMGTVVSLSRGMHVALVYRDYSPRFVSLHATGFGERSETKNERGLYLGAEMRLAKWLRLSGYVDHFRFPWRTFDNPLPTNGRDLLLQADASLSPVLDLALRYSNKATEVTEPLLDQFSRESRPLLDRRQQKFRVTATMQAHKQIRVRGRIEKTIVSYTGTSKSESGVVLFQELRYNPSEKFSADARLIFFDTDSYDSRVYEFENDVRGVFTNLSLFGKGRRWYLLLRWQAADILTLSTKYSETQFDGVRSIGSGLTEIRGDVENRISVQFEVRI